MRNPELSGKSLGELMTALPGGVQIVALRREGRNEAASPNFVIAENDVLLATASSKEALAQAGTILGEAAHGQHEEAASQVARFWEIKWNPGQSAQISGPSRLMGKPGYIPKVQRTAESHK